MESMPSELFHCSIEIKKKRATSEFSLWRNNYVTSAIIDLNSRVITLLDLSLHINGACVVWYLPRSWDATPRVITSLDLSFFFLEKDHPHPNLSATLCSHGTTGWHEIFYWIFCLFLGTYYFIWTLFLGF